MGRVHRIAGLRISRVEPTLMGRVRSRDLLPDLEPPEARLRREKSHIFSADSIQLSHDSAMDDVFAPNRRAEHRDLTARATVYAMNLIVMVVALPVGLALLAFNILGGENLRTTSHVMGLTGLFVALAESQSLPVFW